MPPAGAMLVNAIVYISRFTQDRPIDITPSVFGEEKIGISRKRVANYLTNMNYPSDWVTNELSAATLASFNWRDRVDSGRVAQDQPAVAASRRGKSNRD